jgi:hypothetical protein
MVLAAYPLQLWVCILFRHGYIFFIFVCYPVMVDTLSHPPIEESCCVNEDLENSYSRGYPSSR